MTTCNLIQLNRNDVIQMIEKYLSKANPVDLVIIVNQFTKSWIRYSPENNSFVWTGGEKPDYLTVVQDLDDLNKRKKFDNSDEM